LGERSYKTCESLTKKHKESIPGRQGTTRTLKKNTHEPAEPENTDGSGGVLGCS